MIILEYNLSKREAKKIKSKKTIIQSAIMLFAQKGLKDTAIADIMQKANLGIGTFYNYFQSKDDLLRSLLIQLAMNIRQHYLESIRQHYLESLNKEKTQAQILEGLVLYTANLLDQNRFILPLFMRAVDKSALTMKPHVSIKKPLPFKDIFDEIIKTGQDNGEFRNDIPAEIIISQ